MVLCWIALPVFAVLSIFSVKYRKLTKESLECMFKTITFRKCQSGLDDRIKADLTGRIMKRSPKTANFFYKNYKILSWLFLILMILSAYYTSVSLYNYFAYGNCNGRGSQDFCILSEISGEPDRIRELSIAYEVDYDTLNSCFQNNTHLSEQECINHCLGLE